MASIGGATQEPDIFTIGNVIDDKYIITSRLGKGGYGEIYRANRISDGLIVAVKVERVSKAGNLVEEQNILKTLHESGCKRIPVMLTTGVHENSVHYLTMELLGDNLSVLRRKQPTKTFSLRTTCALAIQMLKGIKEVHDHGYLHRDIKPGNFVMGGQKNPREVIIIDYGLSRRYMRPDGTMRAKRSDARWVGSRRYMSPNTHLRKDQGRRDDLWGFLYVVLELYTGTLPWGHLRGLANLDKVRDVKLAYVNDRLVKDLPIEFKKILDHIMSLSFASRPNYRLIHSLLMDMYVREGGKPDSPYDWEEEPIEAADFGGARLSFSSIHSANGFSDAALASADDSTGEKDMNDAGTSTTTTTDTNQKASTEEANQPSKRFQFLEDSSDYSEDSSSRRRKRQSETQQLQLAAEISRQAALENKAENNVGNRKKKKRRCVIQ